MGGPRLETQVALPVKSASISDDAVSREMAHVFSLLTLIQIRQEKGQREWVGWG